MGKCNRWAHVVITPCGDASPESGIKSKFRIIGLKMVINMEWLMPFAPTQYLTSHRGLWGRVG